MSIVNVSAYKFVDLSKSSLPSLKKALLKHAIESDLKGTVLLSTEGINLFIAGTQLNLDNYLKYLSSYSEFSGLPCKFSPSGDHPFSRMLVRIKKEIISMGRDDIQPSQFAAPHLSAETLKQWYDDNKDMIVLDTRNDYEVKLGTFKGAVDLNIETFRAFPDAVQELPEEYKNKPIVTFCTGGIRCEKAAAYMLKQGFKEVYQLEGGILKYFETCSGNHYQGECFVFDKRVAVNSELNETATEQCFACRMPLPPAEQQHSGYCPHCEGNALTGIKKQQQA